MVNKNKQTADSRFNPFRDLQHYHNLLIQFLLISKTETKNIKRILRLLFYESTYNFTKSTILQKASLILHRRDSHLTRLGKHNRRSHHWMINSFQQAVYIPGAKFINCRCIYYILYAKQDALYFHSYINSRL